MSAAVPCPTCGRSWPESASLSGGCPACLLAFAFTGADAPAAEPHQTHVGQYRLLELLGEGGMGTVYKARHDALGRVVALKVMRPEFARRPGFAERFRREGETLAALAHPGIVAVFDSGCEGGTYYLAMEYVSGGNLRRRLAEGRLPWPEVRDVVCRVADALQCAHDRGVVHRDVKPENVLLDDQGHAKLADFGVARLLGDEHATASLTNTGSAVGTRCYMSPEQLEGRPVDARSDVYALGVLLYELATGSLPLGVFAPPGRTPGVDPRLDSVVLRALAKHPADRYPTAAAFRDAIPPLRNGRRRRRRWAVAAVVLGVGVAALGLSTVPDTDPGTAREASSPAPHPPSPSIPKPGEPLVLAGHTGPVDSVAFAPDGRLASASGDRSIRLWHPDGTVAATIPDALPGQEFGSVAVAWLGDRTLAAAGRESVIRLWDVPTGTVRVRLAGHAREVTAVAATTDGKTLVSAGLDQKVLVWDLARGKPRLTLDPRSPDGRPHPPLSVAVSADGTRVAAGLMSGAVLLWDAATGERLHPGGVANAGHTARVRALAFAADGWLASGGHDHKVRLWPSDADDAPFRTLDTGTAVWAVAFDPGGRRLATAGEDGLVRLWELDTDRVTGVLRGHTGKVGAAAFAPDGRRLATGGSDGTVRLWPVAR